MTPKSRYFLVGAGAVLLMGLGGGLIAYFAYSRVPGNISGLPAELRYVPADAELVAYADVQAFMKSELRRGLESLARGPNNSKDPGAGAPGSRDDRRVQIDDFAGINVEKQVNHVVAYLESASAEASGAMGPSLRKDAEAQAQGAGAQRPPRALVLVQGTFEQPRIEQFIREHGGTIEDYHGKHIATHKGRPRERTRGQGSEEGRGQSAEGRGQSAEPPPTAPPEVAVGFVQPGLIALGQADLVRRALGAPPSGSKDISDNAQLITLIKDASASTAWVVGSFDAMSRRMGMPASLARQVPPVRLVSAKADINGGLKAMIRAETADQAAADQVRDVVRGFIALIRLQSGGKPELQETLKSIELSGTNNAVQLSFAMTPETFKLIQPPRRQRPDRQPQEPESAPRP